MAAMRDELSACRLARIPQIPIIPKIDPRRFISPSRFTGFVAWLKRMRNRQTPLSRARAHYATLAQLFLDYFTMNLSRSMRSSTRWEPTRKGPEPNVQCLEKDWTHSNIALLPTFCILTGGNVYLCCTRELDFRFFADPLICSSPTLIPSQHSRWDSRCRIYYHNGLFQVDVYHSTARFSSGRD